MRLFRGPSLLAVFRDLRTFFAHREKHEYWGALVAIGVTAFIVYGFYHDSKFERQPQIIYVNNWPLNRSDAQIRKEQHEDALARRQAEAARRAEFQKLADSLGIDTKK